MFDLDFSYSMLCVLGFLGGAFSFSTASKLLQSFCFLDCFLPLNV